MINIVTAAVGVVVADDDDGDDDGNVTVAMDFVAAVDKTFCDSRRLNYCHHHCNVSCFYCHCRRNYDDISVVAGAAAIAAFCYHHCRERILICSGHHCVFGVGPFCWISVMILHDY